VSDLLPMALHGRLGHDCDAVKSVSASICLSAHLSAFVCRSSWLLVGSGVGGPACLPAQAICLSIILTDCCAQVVRIEAAAEAFWSWLASDEAAAALALPPDVPTPALLSEDMHRAQRCAQTFRAIQVCWPVGCMSIGHSHAAARNHVAMHLPVPVHFCPCVACPLPFVGEDQDQQYKVRK
jgi:hypothetical protein